MNTAYVGEVFKFYEDHFIPYSGGWKNFPRPIEGLVLESWCNDDGIDHIRLADGRIFKRYPCYLPSSPYGWDVL